MALPGCSWKAASPLHAGLSLKVSFWHLDSVLATLLDTMTDQITKRNTLRGTGLLRLMDSVHHGGKGSMVVGTSGGSFSIMVRTGHETPEAYATS